MAGKHGCAALLSFAAISGAAASAAAQSSDPFPSPISLDPAPPPRSPGLPPSPAPPPPYPPPPLSPLHDEPPQAQRLPVSIVERPITLPESTFSIDAGVYGGRSEPLTGDPHGFLGTSLGFSYGITDNLEIGVSPLGVAWAPEIHYNNPSVGLTYKIARSLGLGFGVTYLQPDWGSAYFAAKGGLVLGASVLLRAYLEHRAKLFFNPALNVKVPFSFGSTLPEQAEVGALFPISIAIKIVEPVSLGVATGLDIYTLQYAGDSTYIPLSLGVTFSVPGQAGPVVDINPYFAWPYLFHPANNGPRVSSSGDFIDVQPVTPGTFTLGLTLSFYAYL